MKLFLYPSKLLISISLMLCISLSSCGGGGGSTGTSNMSTISNVSIGQENALSSAVSIVASSVNSELSSSSNEVENTGINSNSSHSDSQTVNSAVSSIANSTTNTSVRSSSEENSSANISNSAISNISSIGNPPSSSSKLSTVSSSTIPILPLSSSSSSVTSVALSSSSSSAIRSSSKAATSSAYSSSLTQINSSSIASSSSTLSSSSLSPTGTAFHLRGTHNAWVEGDLFTQVVGSTTDLEICRNFLPVVGGQTFKIDPDGDWGNDAFPASSVAASGWTKIVINADIRTIQSVNKDLAENCGTPSSSSSSLISSSNSSSSLAQASSSSASSSSLDSFSFRSIYDAPIGTEIISEEIRISGLEGVGFIHITGGEFSIDSKPFQKNTSKIYNNQTLAIKVKAAALGSTVTQALLALDDVRGTRNARFTVTTAVDITPNIFTFTPAINSQLNTAIYSNAIVVKGVDGNVPISITGEGASYAIANKTYTSIPGTVNNNQTVTISLKSANTISTSVSATLTIGSMSQTFIATTVSETSAPIAKFVFPASISATDKNSIVVRGQASDMNEVISVKVNGLETKTTDGYANWQINVPLQNGENILTVSTRDNLNNYLNRVTTVKVISGPGNVPDSINQFDGPVSVALDTINKRLIVSDEVAPRTNLGAPPHPAFYFVDLVTGARTAFNVSISPAPFDFAIDVAANRVIAPGHQDIYAIKLSGGNYTTLSDGSNNDLPLFSNPCCIAIDATRSRAIVVNQGNASLIAVDLSTGERSALSSNTAPSSTYKFKKPYGIVIDENYDRALVLDSNDSTGLLIAVDLTTGARTMLPINSAQSTSFVKNPQSITLDRQRNRVLISEIDGGETNSVDLTTGVTTPIENLPNSNKIVIDSGKDIAYVASYWLKSIFLVDLLTGEKVTFSR